MSVICYIINFFAPITNMLGLFGALLAGSREEWDVLYMAIPFAIAGLIFGIFAYSRDIPPRMFWAESVNNIFSFTITIVIGYILTFAAYPLAWYIATDFIETVSK